MKEWLKTVLFRVQNPLISKLKLRFSMNLFAFILVYNHDKLLLIKNRTAETLSGFLYLFYMFCRCVLYLYPDYSIT